MGRLIGYVRVSTEEQHLSPGAQEDQIRAWSSLTHHTIVRFERDLGVSGAADLEPSSRPGLMRAIEAVGVDADGIVVLRRDRLARALINACAIEALVEKSGGSVLCVDGTGNGNLPTDRLIRQIVDSFAEYERAMISLRIRDAFARKREQGERLGKVPFGYRVCETPGRKSHSGRPVGLEPDPGEQEIIARIHAARAKGMSLRQIVESLNKQGVPARGKCWHLSSVVRILDLPPPGVERPA